MAEKRFSRSQILRGAIPATGAAALATGFLFNELKASQHPEIVTRDGNFYPIYEYHGKGIHSTDIPKNIDVLFRESGNFPIDQLREAPSKLGQFGMESGRNLIPDDILNEINSRTTQPLEVMFGDINPVLMADNLSYVEFYAAKGIVGGLAAAALVLQKIRESRQDSKTPEKTDPSRRKVLTATLGAIAAWQLSSVAIDTDAHVLFENVENEGFQRILDRIAGLSSDLHPEEVIIFFRNAVMASHMLYQAREYKKLGKTVNLAFWTEGRHSGIEDFLKIGLDATRSIILSFPPQYLKAVVEQAGGIDNFCAFYAVAGFSQAPGKPLANLHTTVTIDQEFRRDLINKIR